MAVLVKPIFPNIVALTSSLSSCPPTRHVYARFMGPRMRSSFVAGRIENGPEQSPRPRTIEREEAYGGRSTRTPAARSTKPARP